MTGPRAQAQEYVASFAQRIAEIRSRTEAARAALRSVTATASSPDGRVTVTVDSAGVLTDIAFGTVSDCDPATLARTVLDTAREARLQVLADARTAVVENVGADSPALRVLDEQAAALGGGTAAAESGPAAGGSTGDAEDGFTGRGR